MTSAPSYATLEEPVLRPGRSNLGSPIFENFQLRNLGNSYVKKQIQQ